MEKLVSVLMCVYNTPLLYLEEAVESICNQSYKNLEFVIVDDCSEKKETIDYLKTIESRDQRIKLIKNSNNTGLTKALNIGLAYCGGDYIARMDADDVSATNRIEVQVSYMEDHPDVAMVGSHTELIEEGDSDKEKGTDEYMYDNPEMYIIRALVRHPGPAHPTFLFRSSFLHKNQIQYNESIQKGQDYNIITRILEKRGKIEVIKNSLLRYRIHPYQITATSELEQLIYQSKTSYDYLRIVFPELTEAERAALSTICWYEDKRVLEEALRKNEEMKGISLHLIVHRKDVENPESYRSAIRKIIYYNKKARNYNQKYLKEEFQYLWWKKATRMSKEYHCVWGMDLFAVRSYMEVLKRRIRKRY